MKQFRILAALLFVAGGVMAQPGKRISPLAVDSFSYKDLYAKVVYSQPHKNNRDIFGKLVPFGQVWRTGANEATEFTATKDILVSGQRLKAGTYSIFTIPEKDKWTVIFSSDLGLWGSYDYNKERDALRFDVPTRAPGKPYEDFTIEFRDKNDAADVVISWDNTQVSFSIQYIEPGK